MACRSRTESDFCIGRVGFRGKLPRRAACAKGRQSQRVKPEALLKTSGLIDCERSAQYRLFHFVWKMYTTAGFRATRIVHRRSCETLRQQTQS